MLRHGLPVLLIVSSAFGADVITYHNDNARTGQNLTETVLTTLNVKSNTFGKLLTIPVDGRVDAQPLYLSAFPMPQGTRNVLYVATEHDSVYAFDADTGAQLWKVSMLKAGEVPSDDRSCGQVTPEIGVSATPVIDRAGGTIYLVAMSKDSTAHYHQRLHALALTTGAEKFAGPKDVQATYPGTGDNTLNGNVVFDPAQYKDLSALLLMNGVVYTSWSSHCDHRPYTGWVMSYDAASLAQISVLNLAPNGNEAGIWMAGAGPAADAAGNLYLLAGNGTWDGAAPGGFPANGDYGNGFLKISTANNRLSVADYFEMSNSTSESGTDTDLGSGGALVLPDMVDANGVTRHLAVGAGKDHHIYLVDRDNMGKFNSTSNGNYQDLTSALPGGAWSMPAYFNGRLYYGGVNDVIKGFTFTNARLVTPPSFTSTTSYSYPGTTPSISANGTGNGIVWAVQNGNPAVLHAYTADLNELYNSNQAAGGRDQFGSNTKFITPTIVNGKVYVGTPNSAAVFGILPTNNPAPVITSPLSASGIQHKSFSYQITATNSPTSYSATSLPAGLTVNTSTGLISGTPKGQGTSNVTIRATNSGGTGTAMLVITITKH